MQLWQCGYYESLTAHSRNSIHHARIVLDLQISLRRAQQWPQSFLYHFKADLTVFEIEVLFYILVRLSGIIRQAKLLLST